MKQYYIYILEEDEEISAELIDHLSNNNNIWIEAVNNLQSTNHSEVKLEHNITTVEKAIRHAIENSWNQGDKRKINTIIRAAPDSLKGKPTNSEFIALIADKLKIKNRYAFESR